MTIKVFRKELKSLKERPNTDLQLVRTYETVKTIDIEAARFKTRKEVSCLRQSSR
jgi:hypothetical protein